ncbi:IS21 family transposase (plasmid) [Sulfitobacter pontiacus]|uniref:IS21 family transposase n=1 Tax=Rhodobacterales TaxID=204455 RepID=UPI00198AFFE4|nr:MULTISPECIES: IS21 family transposase [Rhodobacterales]MBC7147631.1 IS21 family transposase [Thioclava marina]MDF2143345.1 IS21 family transposase [Paenirhodobacter sp. CAU 1674]MDY6861074.1 IS21 family transposase [Pseudomonadota bacterium]WPZ27809.1 IS21 family transposase [Sulfitobacter pontiacus]
MYTVDLYLKVRQAHFQDGLSGRQIARDFGVSRDSVAKMLAYSEPPGYRRTAPIRRPKLDAFTGQIDQWLAEDKVRPRKQRHTAKRIFERLRDECGFDGGYTIVKDYVRTRKRTGKEMFVPLSHQPGHAQADFGEALVVIGGVEQKARFFAFDLPHSDACYVRAYPAATTEAWLDGHVHAFAFFGAVPQSILYDNDRCLVARIMPDGTRDRTQRFSAMLSHYVIRDRYGRPGKGNDKGKVEGLVGYARRNFMVPIPSFPDWDAFNAHLEEQCRKRQGDVLRGHKASIGARLDADLSAMRELPGVPFDACDLQSGQVTSTSVVRYRGNDYSVPVAYGHREVWIKGFVTRVVIGSAAEVIADHPRSYDTGDMVFDPLHYLPLIEHKIMAFDQAAPLQGWELPEAFATLQRLLEARQGKTGKREYVQVLRLLERFEVDALHLAIKDALRMGAISFDAIKHLVLCRVERRPPRLDLDVYPFLPRTSITTTSAASYMSLLAGGGA